MLVILKLAWRNLWRHRRRSFITATAMAVGAALTLGMVALSDGIYTQMFDGAVRQQLGHVQVHHPSYPARRSLHETMTAADVLPLLDAIPGVAGVSPRAFGFALLGAGEKAAGASLLGVDPSREPRVTRVHERVIAGRYLAPSPAGEVLLGKGLAEALRVEVGGEVVAVTQGADGSMGNELYRVVGIYQTGSVALDRAGAILHLADLQALLSLDGRIHEVALLAPGAGGVEALLASAQAAAGGRELLVRSWDVIDPVAGQMIKTQDAAVGVLLFIVFSVAALGILNTMLMSVFERIRELGVLQALGLSPWQLMALVLVETVLLGGLGAVLGTSGGLVIDWWLVTRGIDLSSFTQGYSFAGVFFEPVMRGEFRPGRVVAVILAMLAVSVLASLWPAIRAARLDPVVAMREGR